MVARAVGDPARRHPLAYAVSPALTRDDDELRSLSANQSRRPPQAFLAAFRGGMVTLTGFVFSMVLLKVTRALPAQDHAIWLTRDPQGIDGSR